MDDMGCTDSIERNVPIDTLQCGVLFLLSVGFVASSVCVYTNLLVEGKIPQSPLEPSLRDGQRILRMLELRTLGIGTDAITVNGQKSTPT